MTEPTRMGATFSGKQHVDLSKTGWTDEEFEQAKKLKAPLQLFTKLIEMTDILYPYSKEDQVKYIQDFIDLANTIWAKRIKSL